MTAADLTAVLAPFNIRHAVLGSLTDPSTWTLTGGDVAGARAALQAVLFPPAPSNTFWPSSLDQLRADLARVEQELIHA